MGNALKGGEGGDNLNKNIDDLKDLLLPQYSEEKERKAKWAKKLLEEEVKKGVIQIQSMSKKSGKKR